jgi:hypothetical protein
VLELVSAAVQHYAIWCWCRWWSWRDGCEMRALPLELPSPLVTS